LTATSGYTKTEVVDLSLTVSDCEGESSTDAVSVSYSCTGS